MVIKDLYASSRLALVQSPVWLWSVASKSIDIAIVNGLELKNDGKEI